jgi:methionyl aminopeptidase
VIQAKMNRHAGLIKSDDEIAIMRDAGRILGRVRERLVEKVSPGVSTLDIDNLARELVEASGSKPAFLGYRGYPGTVCASINEEVVHGIPSAKRRLAEGDLISIDIGLIRNGFYVDTATTVAVGKVTPEVDELIRVTRASLDIGIAAARSDKRLGDISSAIQTYVESEGLTVVREYTGHGIGRELHEDPKIPNFGPPGKGMRLRAGMVMALEPMVNLGTWSTEVLSDGWTVVTADRKPSAHFEHTIVVTANGPEILTA